MIDAWHPYAPYGGATLLLSKPKMVMGPLFMRQYGAGQLPSPHSGGMRE